MREHDHAAALLSSQSTDASTSIPASVCATCGESLGSDGVCLACLLRVGLDGSEAPLEETRFGDFKIVRRDDGELCELGRGAMGVTYRARDTVLHREVALKVIAPAAKDAAAVRERLLREARAAATLRHPHVASVFQFGVSPGGERCYCAIELIEGETLEARIRREGPLPVATVLEMAEQVTSALIAAAERGLVHRDLKPGNIMLGRTDDRAIDVKVIDFGLAKAVRVAGEMELTQGAFVGTPAFASPEQFAGREVDARTDIYALGVTMWFALTGRLPFGGTTIEEIQQRQAEQRLPLEQLEGRGVPQPLRRLLRACVAVDPAERPASARDLLAALQDCRAANMRRRRTRRFVAFALAAMVVAAIGLTLLSRRSQPVFAPASNGSAPAPAPAPAEKRVAVLPFKPLVAEDQGQILAIGMADSLIERLSSSRQIIVTSLTSVRRYAEMDRDPVEAGRELNVGIVLEGNVQRDGDAIRVTARLINVADGTALWAGKFDEQFTNVFAVQDAISQRVADALALELTGAEKSGLTRRDTDNPEAYRLYLTGRYHWSKLAPPEIMKSIGFFEQAIALDPNYALAYFGLADAYRVLSMTGDLRPKDTFPQAAAAARKAIDLDPTLAEPHVTLSFIQTWYEWDWSGAEREARRALQLNPNLPFGHIALSLVLSATGRREEAVVAAKRARQLDPVSPPITALAGACLLGGKHYDEAAEYLQTAVEVNPQFWLAHYYLGQLYTQQKKYGEALAELTAAVEASHGNADASSMRAYLWAITGETAKAQGVLDELKSESTQRYVPPSSIAVVLYGLGDREGTFAWLEKGCEERDPHITFLVEDAKWDPIRADPRFVAILHRLGLRAQ
ncbi:MAG: protein kinase [Chthoniobacterales bacterium]